MVLFLDEVDALQGNSLVSILSQLRDGHNARPEGHPFPASVVLCGLRDLRDYKVASGGDPGRSNPASPFNIIAESLRLGDFNTDEIAELYDQHTQATGQEFTKDAVDRVFELTQGQPWLVNALAYEIIFKMGVTGDITAGQVEDGQGAVDPGARHPPGRARGPAARAPGQAGDRTDRGRLAPRGTDARLLRRRCPTSTIWASSEETTAGGRQPDLSGGPATGPGRSRRSSS